MIAQHLEEIRQQLPPHVRLIAVTKQVPVAAMREAYAAGIRDFGENRLQGALPKLAELADLPDLNWHFIGHLQVNKAKKVLEHFSWIHSVDSRPLAERLNHLAADLPRPPQVCLQVKVLPDPDKYGWEVPELLAALPQLEQLRHLDIQGLMAILPLGLTAAATLAAFESVSDLARQIARQSRLPMSQLSMGMSADYPLAVQAGATMVRLGRVIFGERNGEAEKDGKTN
jgi:pyridoxal phosphate enzyme (YggS family)